MLLGACLAGAMATAVSLGAPETAPRASSEASAQYQAKHPNVKTVGGPVSAPVLVKRFEPEYPEELTKKERDSAPLIVEAVVTSSGSIVDPVVLSAANSDLHPYVIAAVRKWRYKPAREKGKTVPVFVMISFRVGAPHA
jgi:protein TonB